MVKRHNNGIERDIERAAYVSLGCGVFAKPHWPWLVAFAVLWCVAAGILFRRALRRGESSKG